MSCSSTSIHDDPRAASDAGDGDAPSSDADGASPTCDPDEEPGDGIFASASSGDDAAGDGTPGQPLRTIGAAILQATASGKSVIYLDAGTYKEAFAVPDLATGLWVEGGFFATGAVWKHDCSPDARKKTVIAGPSNAAATVTAKGLTRASGLRRLSVVSANHGPATADQSGKSSVAVWIDASVFSLFDVDVSAGNGGDAGAASQGKSGATLACNGLSDCGSGASALAAGQVGAAAGPGTLTSDGWKPGDGSSGDPGEAGKNGTPSAQGPQSASCPQGCSYPGSGCGCDADPSTNVSGGAGKCGCGGEAGGGGAPGRGGGASIALFVTGASTVVVERASLAASGGGAGSTGGLGGSPGAGKDGSPGGDASCVTGCGNGGVCANCGTVATSVVKGGAAGGKGGSANAGGPGGPGAGGPSFSVVRAQTAKLLAKDSSTSFGKGGKGASNDGQTAPDGAAGVESLL